MWANYVPLQVRYGKDPATGEVSGWRVLAICILLNQTSRRQVEQVLDDFFKNFPYPSFAELASLYEDQHLRMESILEPLGFQHVKTNRIGFMSKEWLDHKDWRNTDRVHLFSGCGQYAVDAWRIFVDHDLSRPATDQVLEAWRQGQLAAHA